MRTGALSTSPSDKPCTEGTVTSLSASSWYAYVAGIGHGRLRQNVLTLGAFVLELSAWTAPGLRTSSKQARSGVIAERAAPNALVRGFVILHGDWGWSPLWLSSHCWELEGWCRLVGIRYLGAGASASVRGHVSKRICLRAKPSVGATSNII